VVAVEAAPAPAVLDDLVAQPVAPSVPEPVVVAVAAPALDPISPAARAAEAVAAVVAAHSASNGNGHAPAHDPEADQSAAEPDRS
jgi:hypothetical protein